MYKSLTRNWFDIARTLRFFLWDGYSSHDYSDDEPALEQVYEISDGNIYSSEIDNSHGSLSLTDRRHKVAIDVDVPAVLIPSSTEGHQHLLIDVELTWEEYSALLNALEAAGIIEPGYNEIAQKRHATHLRVPWEVKSPQEQGMVRKLFRESVQVYEKTPAPTPKPVISDDHSSYTEGAF